MLFHNNYRFVFTVFISGLVNHSSASPECESYSFLKDSLFIELFKLLKHDFMHEQFINLTI